MFTSPLLEPFCVITLSGAGTKAWFVVSATSGVHHFVVFTPDELTSAVQENQKTFVINHHNHVNLSPNHEKIGVRKVLIQRKFVFHAINNAHNEAITSQTGTAKAHRIAPAKVKNETTPDNTNQSVHRIARSERRTPETINNDSVNCGFLQIQLFSHSRIGVKAWCDVIKSDY
jgi:hypothetical protein